MAEQPTAERWQFPTEPEPIESSMLRTMRYDPKEHLLEVVFRNGRAYQFVNVPPEIYEHLHTAQSKGRYFLAHIRNQYPFWRLHRGRGASRRMR